MCISNDAFSVSACVCVRQWHFNNIQNSTTGYVNVTKRRKCINTIAFVIPINHKKADTRIQQQSWEQHVPANARQHILNALLQIEKPHRDSKREWEWNISYLFLFGMYDFRSREDPIFHTKMVNGNVFFLLCFFFRSLPLNKRIDEE